MSNPGRIKIFSSHCWSYNDHRQGLHGLLAPHWIKNVDYIDLSIPRAHPVEVESDIGLAAEIRDRIKSSDVLLVFAAMYTNNSDWVKFEIHSAFNDNCPIVAVIPNGQERLSRTATKFATRAAHWRGESIRNAIWELLPDKRKSEYHHARRLRIAHALRQPFAGLRPPEQSYRPSEVGLRPESPSVFLGVPAPGPKKWP